MKSLKILVTGRNRRIASDICEHLSNDRGYIPMKCGASKKALFDKALNEYPNVVIICTGDENEETIKVFDILREIAKVGALEVIVIANEHDRKAFMTNSKLEKFFLLSRPVSLLALYQKLEEFEEKFGGNEISLQLEEYINDKKQVEFERKHILVVDDDPEQLMMIKEHLQEFYEVTVINGGKNILRVLKKFKVDLILLDYMMPEMDGPSVLKLIRQYPQYAEIPVVFLTGMAERDTVIELFVHYKPQGYVLKPSKKSEIVAKIIDVLG